MPTSSHRDYALDLLGPVRHVATKLEEARPSGRALPVSELAEGLRPITGDLHRIKLLEGARSDTEAIAWLARTAAEELVGHGVERDNGGYRLPKPLERVRWQRRKVHPFVDEHATLRDPFNPNSGDWAESFARRPLGDLTELTESMRTSAGGPSPPWSRTSAV